MLYKASTAAALCLLLCSGASAQTVYEPVQSQYRVGDRSYYYGGSDPRAHDYARRRLACLDTGTRYLREGRFGVGLVRRGLIGEPPQYTVSDCAPYLNGIVYGYTSVDARNDAYASIPRFFRMADLAAAAVPAGDGVGVVVPAQAPGTIGIRPSAPRAAPPASGPATRPTPVMIFPKKALEPRPVPGESRADAR